LIQRPLVIIESPYASRNAIDRIKFDAYLKICMIDSLKRGESPFASHGFYTQVLEDKYAIQRAIGIQCGFAWGSHAELIAVYTDHGISDGMQRAIDYYEGLGIKAIERKMYE